MSACDEKRKCVVVPGFEDFSFYCVRQLDPVLPARKKNAPDDDPDPAPQLIWRMHETNTGRVITWGKTRPECIARAKTLLDPEGADGLLKRLAQFCDPRIVVSADYYARAVEEGTEYGLVVE